MKHPYYTMNQLMHEHYGQKLRKICVDGGFTCPNRDGTCGFGGCTFCGERGAGEQLDPTKSIREQVTARLEQAPPDSMWILYFQNFTNTYAPAETLRARYDAALIDDRIKVLDIGTRPDCIDENVAALLAEYARRYEVWVELGLQTANDATARAINRGYDLADFSRAVEILHRYGLPVIVHLIIGLPHETLDDIRHTIDVVNAHHVAGVKLHSLFVMRGTKLAQQYQNGEFTPITMNTYIDWTIDALCRISPQTVIHRLTGNCLREYLLAPDWIPQRDLILVTIDRRMAANGWSQGCMYSDVPHETIESAQFSSNCSERKDTMNDTAPKGIIFDLDGTLLDTLGDLASAVNAALAAHGIPQRTVPEVRRFVGNGIAKLVARAIPEGTNHPEYDAVLADTRAEYARRCRDTTAPYDGIPDALQTLRARGYIMAVLSNKPDAQVKKLCADFFPGLFTAAVGQREGVPLKPDAAPLLATVREMGCMPADCVYVGDSDVDIQTARNAQIPCISVLWGFRDQPDLIVAGGTTFAESPAEMCAFFP